MNKHHIVYNAHIKPDTNIIEALIDLQFLKCKRNFIGQPNGWTDGQTGFLSLL